MGVTTDRATELKQACLDMSNAALALFDEIDRDGTEGGWTAKGAGSIVNLVTAFEVVREFYARQATRRMLALGISPERLAQMDMGRRPGRTGSTPSGGEGGDG